MMEIKDGKTLLFVGDSITDCGRSRPVGVGGDGLGDGYVRLVDSLLASTYPQRCIKVLNTGISGNRVTDLESRWQSDVLDLKPDWLSVMIGINDVWRHFDDASNPHQVTIEYFEAALRELVSKVQGRVDGLVLMTPFYLESDKGDAMRSMMDQYGASVRKVANESNARFVDTQAAFDTYLAERPSASLCGDKVHPSQVGHMVLAKAFLDEVGYRF